MKSGPKLNSDLLNICDKTRVLKLVGGSTDLVLFVRFARMFSSGVIEVFGFYYFTDH